MNACPCGSGRAYDDCCGPAHRGIAPESAQALMRSRYSAYVRGDIDYLLDSWHASTRPASLELEPSTRWLGLEIKRHAMTGDDTALVEFVARYKLGGAAAVRLHEVSRFVREDDRWYYVDGDFPQR